VLSQTLFIRHETLLANFHDIVKPMIDELREMIIARADNALEKEPINTVFEYFIELLLYDLLQNNFSLAFVPYRNVNNTIVDFISKNGMCILDIDPSYTKAIKDIVMNKYYEDMVCESKLASHRIVREIGIGDDIGDIFKNFFSEYCIVESLSNYQGVDIKFIGAGLEYSHPGQMWHTYEGSQKKTEYMHFDYGYYHPKILWYLSDVESEENGCTKYIPGSHLWEKSRFRHSFFRSVQNVFSARYRKLSSKSNNYYAFLFEDKIFSKALNLFPSSMVGSASFGGFIEDDSEVSSDLLSKEINFLSSGGGKVIVFDGGRGIHRGALVQKGYRLSMQLCFYPKNDQSVLCMAKEFGNTHQNNNIREQEMGLIDKIDRLDAQENLVLYGFGEGGMAIYSKYKKIFNISTIIDDAKIGEPVDDKYICGLNSIKNIKNSVVVISSFNKQAVELIYQKIKQFNSDIKIISI